MGSQKRIVPDEAIRWVEKAYKEVQPILPSNFRTEPGEAPPPGSLNKTEKPSNNSRLSRIREVLRGTHYLIVLEIKLNLHAPASLYGELAWRLSKECGFPRDTAHSLVINNWSNNCNVTVEQWAETKQISIYTVNKYQSRGRYVLNRWYNEAIIKAWEGR